MAFKNGDRASITFLPATIDDYVSQDDPVRVYDEMIDLFYRKGLDLEMNSGKVGPSCYNPLTMLKVLVYAYSYGWRSSRKIERALNHNLSFIWLAGGLKPDHKTIANFRRHNKDLVTQVFKKVARLCIDLNLIEGNCLFLDGSKIRGNASINASYSKKALLKKLKEIDARIDQLLDECETVDNQETGEPNKVSKDLKTAEKRRAKIEEALKRFDKTTKNKVNTTDPDAVNFKSRQGYHSGYNGQVTTDEKHGLAVSCDVVSDNTDLNHFTEQINQANENLGKNCKTAVADAGYSSLNDIKDMDENIDVIVPNCEQASGKEPAPFDKDKFIYDEEKDCYICPEGKILKYSSYKQGKHSKTYRINSRVICRNCPHFGKCTKCVTGRGIARSDYEELKQKLQRRYEENDAREIYARRQYKIEKVFGHIKRNLNGGHFLMRGIENVKAEFSLLLSCFNITRLINIFGGSREALKVLRAL